MESEAGFHESFGPQFKNIKVTWASDREYIEAGQPRFDLRTLDKVEYYPIIGIPSYIVRKVIYRNGGSSPSYQLIHFVPEQKAKAVVEIDGVVYFGEFGKIATTSQTGIIRQARDNHLMDMLQGVNISLDPQS